VIHPRPFSPRKTAEKNAGVVQKESKNKSQTTTNKWQTGKRPKKKSNSGKKTIVCWALLLFLSSGFYSVHTRSIVGRYTL